MTLGEEVCNWIEEYCHVPDGDDVGKPVRLRDWQRHYVLEIYDQPPERRTRLAIISFGRKNGKTALAAMLLLAHLAGPVRRENAQLYSAAQKREQAAVLFDLAAKMIALEPRLADVLTVREYRNEIVSALSGAAYKALSADVKGAFGKSPAFVVHDELGQVDGNRSKLFEALETGRGAHSWPLSLVLSTQAEDDGALLSELIDDAHNDAHTRLFLHRAEPEDDPYAESTWRKANPALGDFNSLTELRAAAEKARRLPAFRPVFQNLHLNMRVSAEQRVFTEAMWMGCEEPGLSLDDLEGRPCYAGLDLSSKSDLTSMALCFPRDGWACFVRSWVAADKVEQLGESWNAPYRQWIEDGWLVPSGHAAIDYTDVADWIREIGGRFDLRRVAADPARLDELLDHLRDDFPTRRDDEGTMKMAQSPFFAALARGESPPVLFRMYSQQPATMEPAIGDLETKLDGGELRLEPNPVTRWAARQTRVSTTTDGQRRPVKRSSGDKRWKIDPVVALLMAVRQAVIESDLDPAAGSILDDEAALDFLESLV